MSILAVRHSCREAILIKSKITVHALAACHAHIVLLFFVCANVIIDRLL